MSRKDANWLLSVSKAVQEEVDRNCLPPQEGTRARGGSVVPLSIVKDTRGYIDRIANQVNGTYENGWYDGCAVMIRRLLETLIIETFEHHNLAERIKLPNDPYGNFMQLGDLISKMIDEKSWNLTRNAKQALPRLKDVGDKSAHSRRFLAQRADIDKIQPDVRLVVQELVFLSGLKK